jgi:integrase
MGKVTLYRPKGRNKKKGSYYAKWMEDGRYVRRSLDTTDWSTAKDIRKELEAGLLSERFGLAVEVDLTWKDAWAEYIRIALGKKPSTIEIEGLGWRQFFEWSKRPTLASVKRSDVAGFQRYLLDDRGNNVVTVNDKVRQLGTVWGWLTREEVITLPNPFSGRKRLDEGARKVRVIPWPIIEGMLTRTREADDPMHLVLVLGAYAGLRKGEILAARWEDIDWAGESLSVRGEKTKASQAEIHLHPALRDALTPYRQDSGHIVQPGKDAGSRYRFDFRKQWERVKREAGIPEARLHDLRHSFATRLLDLGYSLKDIAVMLRHSSTRPTEIYADLRTVKVRIGDINGGQ